MSRLMAVTPFLAVASASVLVTLYVTTVWQTPEPAPRGGGAKGFLTNEQYIDDLYDRALDLRDPLAVFRFVFAHLDDEVLVYPTENYYYFTFPADGRTLWGSLHLPAYRRDEGALGFGYIEKGYDVHAEDRLGGSADLTAADGLEIEVLGDLELAIAFEGRTVLFKLHELDLSPPAKLQLADSEVLVEPTFDESGLGFFLVFDSNLAQLYWILNEEDYVPETFRSHGDDLVIGDRTGFAFFRDAELGRKVLIGVFGPNVMWNNWFDGPFDQLLDNYVASGKVEIQPYLEAHDPSAAGKIDRFGRYLEDDQRLAVASYTTYFHVADLLALLDDCAAAEPAAFRGCITTPNHDRLLDPPFP